MHTRLMLTGLLALQVGQPVAAGEGIAINITNDGTQDVYVTVYDKTRGQNRVVLSNTRVNGFTTIPLSVSPDSSGRANLSWTAVSVDSRERRCGHANNLKVVDSATVAVHADSSCQ